MLGFDRERLLDRPVGELLPQFPGSEQFEVYRRVAVTGEPYTRATRIASMGEELVVSARDVTEGKRNEQELRLRAQLLDLAHDAVIVRDPVDSRVRYWSRGAESRRSRPDHREPVRESPAHPASPPPPPETAAHSPEAPPPPPDCAPPTPSRPAPRTDRPPAPGHAPQPHEPGGQLGSNIMLPSIILPPRLSVGQTRALLKRVGRFL
jgi:hypothetical protein